MAKRWAFVAGAGGYLLAIWYYAAAFAPLGKYPVGDLLWYMCPACMSFTGLHSAVLKMAFFIQAPANAVAFAAIGLAVGKLIAVWQKSRRRGKTWGHP